MEARVIRPAVAEVFTAERCFIRELWNAPEDASLSIAVARVASGVTTVRHCLAGTAERYLIVGGRGRVEVGDLPPTEVGPGDVVVIPPGASQRITNVADADLVFYCLCTPRFRAEAYRERLPAGAP